jgi:cytochrome P450
MAELSTCCAAPAHQKRKHLIYLLVLITGQVTTATAITWMVKYLADNREFQETLRVGGSASQSNPNPIHLLCIREKKF